MLAADQYARFSPRVPSFNPYRAPSFSPYRAQQNPYAWSNPGPASTSPFAPPPLPSAPATTFPTGPTYQAPKPATVAAPKPASTPAPAAAAPSPGASAISMDNLSIANDPVLAQVKAYNQKLISSAEASALAEKQAALIQFGDPTLAGKITDAKTAAAAKGNPFSVLATLLQSHLKNQQSIDNTRNASGNLFYSSTRGNDLTNEGRDYLGNQSNAQFQLMQALRGYDQSVTAAQETAAQNELQATQDAYARALQIAIQNQMYAAQQQSASGGSSSSSDQAAPAAAAVPQPSAPVFAPVAAQQNPYNWSAVGPASTSPFAPTRTAVRRPVPVFSNPRRLAY